MTYFLTTEKNSVLIFFKLLLRCCGIFGLFFGSDNNNNNNNIYEMIQTSCTYGRRVCCVKLVILTSNQINETI